MKQAMAAWAMVLAVLIVGGAVRIERAYPGMYSWTDKDGNMHFSDVPPAQGKAKKLPSKDQEYTVAEDIKDYARLWLNASSYGGRSCNLKEMQRIEKLYFEFRTEADAAIRRCRDGDKKACKYMKIPYAEAATETPYNLQHKYLPPHSIPWAAEVGDAKGVNPWASCR